MSTPNQHQAAPLNFMQKERLRAEAAIEPSPVHTGEPTKEKIGRAHV